MKEILSILFLLFLTSYAIYINCDVIKEDIYDFLVKDCGYSINGCYTPIYIYENLDKFSFRLSVIFGIALIIQTVFLVLSIINFLLSILKITLLITVITIAVYISIMV